MTKKNCLAGSVWDNLVNECVPGRTETGPEPENPTEPPLQDLVQQMSTVRTAPVQVNPVTVLSPALWIFVVLAILGSILALTLWLIIYRRQTTSSRTSEDSDPQQEPLQKTEPAAVDHLLLSERNGCADMLQGVAEASSCCPHLHLGAHTSSHWEEGRKACRDPIKPAGSEGGREPPGCSVMREHRIPLPATELGGTALVTTKTM
ncbi:uncharacterized protein V6R79_015653 [Siganus canaliculatus]